MQNKRLFTRNANLLFHKSKATQKHPRFARNLKNNQITIVEALSPYYTNTTIVPKFIVLHCIGYNNPLEVLQQNKVSCHYLVPPQNSDQLIVYEVVKPPLGAWHAGVSKWQQYTGLNNASIGIEINMPDYAHALDNTTLDFLYFQDYQPNQLTALKILVKQIQNEFNIPPQNIIGHSDIAAWRNINGKIILGKTDPGPTLPWKELADEGIGVWPDPDCSADFSDLSATRAQSLLKNIGYNVPETGVFDAETNLTIGAARLHWTPECFNRANGSAHECYQKLFDTQLACRLNNLSNNNQPNNASISPLFIALITTGPILLIVVLIFAFRFLKNRNRNNYEEIPDEPSINSENMKSMGFK